MRALVISAVCAAAWTGTAAGQALTPDALLLLGAKAEPAMYRGKSALQLTQTGGSAPGDGGGGALAIVKGVRMEKGAVSLEVAGTVAPGAGEGARGFIGIAFRVQGQGDSYEYLYLRPTNGRANDQVRRNHSVQYSSHPGWGWQRLRKEFPEKYESYVDLEAGVWTRIRITFDGAQARLYVHGNEQPALIVDDLRQPAAPGGIALWIGPGTVGYFRGFTATP